MIDWRTVSGGGGGGAATSGTAPFSITGAAGAATALLVNPSTETGSLQVWQVNGASQLSVDAAGTIFGANALSLGGVSGEKSLVINPIAFSKSAELPQFDFLGDAGTFTITAGFATQRFNRFKQPTISGAFTITNAATVAIAGAPIAAGGATLTNAAAFWVQAGLTKLDGAVRLTSLGAFVAADKYVIADSSGNLHVSAIGPAS